MESWKLVFRKGYLPVLTTEQLAILLHGLNTDDLRIQQGHTTTPPPLACVHDWECEGACPLGYMELAARPLVTVGEVEEFFARLCYECDKNMGEPSACREFISWMDETPRNEMRTLLAAEMERAIAERQAEADEQADEQAEIEQSNADAEEGYRQATEEAAREREMILAGQSPYTILSGVEVYDDNEADIFPF